MIQPSTLYPQNGSVADWGNLYIDHDEPGTSSLSFSILDQNDAVIASGLVLGIDGSVDLSFIDVNVHQAIKLQAYFQADPQTQQISPTLNSWYIDFVMDTYTAPSFTFDVGVTNDLTTLSTISSIDNTIRISTTTPEVTLINNVSSTSHDLDIVDVWVEKNVDLTAVLSGDTLTYTINYGNLGPDAAEDVMLTDLLPSGVTYISAQPIPLTTSPAYTWNFGTLAPLATGSITITGIVNNTVTAGDVLTNVAEITTTSIDIDPTNNIDTANSIV